MKLTLAALGAAVILPLLGGPMASAAVPVSPAGATVELRAGCTKTSSGTCIRGGQYCPQASYGKAGYDASRRRYVCKGDRTHPRWMK